MNDSEPAPSQWRRAIDLNADLGEGFANDDALLLRVTSANVCCGFHAGDSEAILRTLEAAKRCGVSVGAHPGYPDRLGFGRREQPATTEIVERLIREQTEFLTQLAERAGVAVVYLKPHGALYNQGQRVSTIARGIARAARSLGLPVLGQPGTLLAQEAAEHGVRFVAEGFPNRRYLPDGSLAPRGEPGAILQDREAVSVNLRRLLAEGGVESLCIHGDEPDAVAQADRIRELLGTAGIAVRSFLGG